MKLFLILLSTVTLLLSCTKKNEKTKLYKSDFVIYLDAVYKKDDSTYLKVYNKKGVEIPELQIFVKVKGAPQSQRIIYRIKPNVPFSNVFFQFSKNNKQENLQISGITIKNNDEFVIGGPADHWDYYFLNNEAFQVNNTTGLHPLSYKTSTFPGMIGNKLLISLIEESQK